MTLDEATARAVRALGDVISPEKARQANALYAPLHDSAPPTDVKVHRDLAYGPHPRHRLDVFTGDRPGDDAAVLVFVHGGNFVGGDKHTAGSPFYDNVGLWAARQGFVGVTMTYRLAPAHTYPAGVEDLSAAVAWLREHVGGYGGSPQRIVLAGASAGAVHVASYLASVPRGAAANSSGVAGAALLSGLYDLPMFARGGADREAVLRQYYPAGTDLAEVSPLGGVVASGVPLLVALTELDPPTHHQQAARLLTAVLEQGGRWPHVAYLPGHNHFTEVLHLGTSDELLARHLLDFVRSLR